MFSGEAYNVEMGVSNDLLPQKRDDTDTRSIQDACYPRDTVNDNIITSTDPVADDIELFSGVHVQFFGPNQSHSTTVPAVAQRRSRTDVPRLIMLDAVYITHQSAQHVRSDDIPGAY